MIDMRLNKLFSLIFIFFISSFIFGCGNAPQTGETSDASDKAASQSNPDYVATWLRQGTYSNGALVSTEPATMILTKNSFDSKNKYCANSGSLAVNGNVCVMNVEKSDCPSMITVGSVVTYTYSVTGDEMTIINTEYGYEFKEIYKKG